MADEKRTELNVVVGDHESLKAAVSAGADSVTVDFFGFSSETSYYGLDELEYSISYCKLFDRKIYVSFTGSIKNTEINLVLQKIAFCDSLRIDGIIISDIAVAKIIKHKLNDLKVILESNFTNADSMNLAEEADRIIIPKELSREEIFRIRKKVNKELQIKVFGEQCFTYQNQCLYSNRFHSRASDLYKCNRPCLKAMKRHNIWRTKDLCLLEKIPEILKVGIETISIDASHLSAYHTLEATGIFRESLDKTSSINQELFERVSLLTKIGFSEGFYSKNKSSVQRSKGIPLGTVEEGRLVLKDSLQKGEKIAFRDGQKFRLYKVNYMIRDKNKVNSSEAGDTIIINYEFFRNGVDVYKISLADREFENTRLPIEINLRLKIGEPIELTLTSGSLKQKVIGEKDVEKAKKIPILKEIIESNLTRLSNTPFKIEKLDISIDEDAIIPYSEINLVKKIALKRLYESILRRKDIQNIEIDIMKRKDAKVKSKIFAMVHDYEGVEEACDSGADIIYYDIFAHDVSETMDYGKKCNIPVYLATPKIIHEGEIEHIKKLIEHYNPEGILVGDIALLSPKIKVKKHLNHNLMLSNDLILNYWNKPGIVSTDLNLAELVSFKYNDLIVYAYGKQVIMTSRFDVRQNEMNIKGNRYTIKKNPYGSVEFIESRITSLLDLVPQLKKAGVKSFFLDLTDNVENTIKEFKKALE